VTQRKRTTTIRREGWYYLFVLAFVLTGAILREINLLMVLAGMMIGPLLVNWRMAVAALRNIDVRRTLPEAVHAGDVLAVQIEIANSNRRQGANAVAVDDVTRVGNDVTRVGGPAEGRRVSGGGVLFAHVAAGQSSSAVYRGRPKRGLWRFGPLKVSTSFPLGFIRRTITLREQAEVIVYPKLGKLTRKFEELQNRVHSDGSRSRQRRGLTEGDFYGLRDWRSGDSQRWIHWRTSARTGKLAVRQFEERQHDDLTLIVDLWSPAEPAEEFAERVEQLLSFAATIVAEHCRRGSSRLLLAVGGTQRAIAHGTTSPALLREALGHLALSQPSSERRLGELLSESFKQSHHRKNVLLLSTGRPDIENDSALATLRRDPKWADTLHHLQCPDLTDGRLLEYFDVE
jgi:uncharacterized protein (DUF58 family)